MMMNGGMASMMGWIMGIGLLGWVLVIALLVTIVLLLVRLLSRHPPQPHRELDSPPSSPAPSTRPSARRL